MNAPGGFAPTIPAARRFLETVFETFERLGKFPESGPTGRLKHRQLADVRFCVVSPPFNRWLIFYRIGEHGVEVLRVVYGTQNWRGNPVSFFV